MVGKHSWINQQFSDSGEFWNARIYFANIFFLWFSWIIYEKNEYCEGGETYRNQSMVQQFRKLSEMHMHLKLISQLQKKDAF